MSTTPGATTAPAWKRVASLDDIPAGGARSFGAVTVFRVAEADGERVVATGSRCPHMGYPMDKGLVRDGVVACAWHQWEFDLGTGGCYRGACHDLPVYPLRIVDGGVEVALPAGGHDRERLARELRDALLPGDIYQQAKAIAGLLDDDATPRDIARIAAKHGFAHSVGAHRSQQAVVELRSVVAAARLAELFTGRERIGILLQGIRTTGGPEGMRETIASLPGVAQRDGDDRRPELLERYVTDPSALAIERLLLDWPADDEPVLRSQLLDLVTRPRFLPDLEAFIAVVDALDACDWLGQAYASHRPALLAWVLGAARGEPEGEERLAVAWLEANRQRVRAAASLTRGGAPSVSADELGAALAAPAVEGGFERLLAWLEAGIAPEELLDAFSTVCARRLDHLRPNNGGLWRTATAGIRMCHAVRRALREGGPHRAQALFLLAWQVHAARWLHPGAPWKAQPVENPSWERYAQALDDSDLPAARREAVARVDVARDGDVGGWLAPLLREDLDADQLATLVACLAELRGASEWQPLVAGPLGYVLENRSRQDVAAAARFGRSIAGTVGSEA